MHKLICDICASDKYVKEGFIIPIWTDIRSGFGNGVVCENMN